MKRTRKSKKNEFISEKIKLLMDEGRPQQQAIAIAYSMADKKFQSGGLKKPLPTYTTQAPDLSGLGVNPNYNQNMDSLNQVQQGYQVTETPMGVQTALGDTSTKMPDWYAQYEKDKQNNVWDVNNQGTANEKYQFFNPYGSVDIPTAAYTLGEGIQSGNTLETVASGLKLATGLGRNFLAGKGAENRRQFVFNEAQQKYREGLTPQARFFQDGGTQDQGVQQINQIIQAFAQATNQDPQVIAQQLQNMSPDEQEQALSQMIQTLQGSEVSNYEEGGKHIKALTGEFTVENEGAKEEDIVAEVEDGEFIKKPDGEVTQVEGETHEDGGVELTKEQLPDNSKIVSNHLKVGKYAKELSKKYDIKISPKDTFARVLEKWGKESGLSKIVEEQEQLIKKLEKQTKLLVEKPEAEKTISLNIQMLQKEINEKEQEKMPLEEDRKKVLDHVFNLQEKDKPEMKEGNEDKVLEYANKHGVSKERAMELYGYFQNGGIKKYQDGDLVQNSTLISSFEKTPMSVNTLPYTPRETNPNKIWQGDNYFNVWKPLVEKSMLDPQRAQQIDSWLMANKDEFSPNIQKQLENKTGTERYNTIQRLATDEKPGLFHNAVLEAIKATTPKTEKPVEEVQPVDNNTFEKPDWQNIGRENIRMGVMGLPDQYAPLPDSLQGNLKLEYRPELVSNQNVTAEPIIAEIRRQEQSAMQGVNNLPDAQRAAAIAQIQANTQAEIAKVMNQVQGQNLQADIQVGNANAQILNQAQDINNRYLLDYEGKILRADALTRNDIRNWMNHNQKVNLANYNAINNLNLLNAYSDNFQYTPQGVQFTNSPELTYSSLTPRQNIEQKAKQKRVKRK